MNKLKDLIIQGFKFFGISGIGWLIDFTVYNILGLFGIAPGICNIFSTLCGVTFVYFVSTRKTFNVNLKRLSLGQKYFIYIAYQIIMILLSSKAIAVLDTKLLASSIELFSQHSRVLAKIFVTPFTMICNFIFMKVLSEKV